MKVNFDYVNLNKILNYSVINSFYMFIWASLVVCEHTYTSSFNFYS